MYWGLSVRVAPFLVKKNTLVAHYLCIMPTTNNYDIVQGSDLTMVLTVTYNGEAVNLTGASIVTTVIDRNGSDIAEVTTTSHTTPASGITTILIPDTTTDTWAIGVYSIQSKCTLADGTEGVIDDSWVNVRYSN